MTVSATPRWYRAHGLTVRSELDLPELTAAPPGDADLSIVLDERAASIRLQAGDAMATPPRGHAGLVALEGGGALFHAAGAGAFWLPDGHQIRVAPEPGADPGAVTLYALGSALGLALMLRGALVLHGASVVIDGRATLFLGPSGAGKSTLAARLAQAGMPALGDDVVALWPGEDGFRVWPAIDSFKVWQDALEALGVASEGLGSVADRADKFFLPNLRRAADAPHPVGTIYRLARAGEAEGVQIDGQDMLATVRALTSELYRPEFVEALGMRAAHFAMVCALAERAKLSLLRRPWGHERAEAVVDAVVRDVRRG